MLRPGIPAWRSLAKLPLPMAAGFVMEVKGQGKGKGQSPIGKVPSLKVPSAKRSEDTESEEPVVLDEGEDDSRHVGDAEDRYDCTFCGRKFQTRSGVRKHMSRHTGNYLYKCEQCDKGYNEIHDYEAHMNRHKGIGFKCMKCNKSLFTMALLLKHQEKCSDLAVAAQRDSGPSFTEEKYPFSNQKPVFPGQDPPN